MRARCRRETDVEDTVEVEQKDEVWQVESRASALFWRGRPGSGSEAEYEHTGRTHLVGTQDGSRETHIRVYRLPAPCATWQGTTGVPEVVDDGAQAAKLAGGTEKALRGGGRDGDDSG